MACKNCLSENIQLLKEGNYHTGYFCNDCGTGRVDHYIGTCCGNQNLIDIRFEQANGTWIQRAACKNCKTLIGGAKKKTADFNNLRPYFQESYQMHQQLSTESYQKLNTSIFKMQTAFREDQKEKWWSWYSEYLKTPQWKAIRQRVLFRENGLCQGCEISPAEHVHHTTYDNVGDELLFQLVALCVSCHNKIHPDKSLS